MTHAERKRRMLGAYQTAIDALRSAAAEMRRAGFDADAEAMDDDRRDIEKRVAQMEGNR